MRKIIIEDRRNIDPFNEPARELRVLNKPLFLQQRDVLLPYCTGRELPVESRDQVSRGRFPERTETLVHRDNLFFDKHFIDEFIQRAQATGKACQVAFSLRDKAIVHHADKLQKRIQRKGDHYVAELWYYPHGIEDYARPLVIDTEPYEAGYYRVPTYMASEQGEMIYYLPMKAFLSIEHWTHIFTASVLFGIFAQAARFERDANRSLKFKSKIFLKALLERKQFMSSSSAVEIGRNCTINPSVSIQGPTIIGDNVTIGAGTHITHCIIGNNVNIMEGCQLMLSVVGDGCYLPFRAALLTTAVMENSIIAQNTCLQKCVVGRNSFIGAGSTFTDYNLVSDKPIRTFFDGKLQSTGTDVMGGCVGHNCRLGAGLIIHPARTIESDTVLVATQERWVISKNVTYEDSDHHKISGGTELHPRLYDPNVRRL